MAKTRELPAVQPGRFTIFLDDPRRESGVRWKARFPYVVHAAETSTEAAVLGRGRDVVAKP